jgi:hypothetical protein
MSRKSQILVSCLATVARLRQRRRSTTSTRRTCSHPSSRSRMMHSVPLGQCNKVGTIQPSLGLHHKFRLRRLDGSSARARGAEGQTITRHDAGDAAVAGAIVGASAQAEAGAAAAAILGRDAVNVMPGGAVAGATAQRDATRRHPATRAGCSATAAGRVGVFPKGPHGMPGDAWLHGTVKVRKRRARPRL